MNRLIILKRFALGGLLVGMLGSSFLSHAQEMVGRWTAAEIASLPQFCKDTLKNENRKKWQSYFGRDNYKPMHHYCFGLMLYSRASTELPSTKSATIQNALGNFNYCLNVWPASFPLAQQVGMYKTQLEMMQRWKK